jgi:Arc/MetJ-type ribon-helix-helix transcriptional regulator
MAIITVRVDEETKRMMKQVKVNWSDFIRNAIKSKLEEERRKNLAKATLINERLRRKSGGEPKAEEIIRIFREDRYAQSGSR